MEGFECKLVSSAAWPFDPLSAQELLLLERKPPLFASSDSHQTNNNKLLAFSTLNLNSSSLSPFDLNLSSADAEDAVSSSIVGVDANVEDINNNSGLVGVSFLTLEPLVAAELAPSSQSRVHILRSCFAPRDVDDMQNQDQSQGQGDQQQAVANNGQTRIMSSPPSASSTTMNFKHEVTELEDERTLPKFAEIRTFHPPQQLRDDRNQTVTGSDANNVEVDCDDVDGIYFSIQELDQYDRDGGKRYMIEDLMGDGCNPVDGDGDIVDSPEFLPPSTVTTLDVDLLDVDEDDDDVGQTSTSNSNSFDLDLDLDDKEGDYSMDVDIAELRRHKLPQLEGEDGEKQELKCKFCGFVCCSKSSLGIHERRHTGERPYACKYCGRLFNSAQCCKHHERLHTGDKPFECQYCGKKYAVSTRLKRHERVHTREEPYKCGEPGCGKTFRWFDAFRDHRNTHNGVALYLCSVCGKSFTSYLKFYYHERGHFLKRERDRDRDRAKKLQLQLQGINPDQVQPLMAPAPPKKKKAAAKKKKPATPKTKQVAKANRG